MKEIVKRINGRSPYCVMCETQFLLLTLVHLTNFVLPCVNKKESDCFDPHGVGVGGRDWARRIFYTYSRLTFPDFLPIVFAVIVRSLF